jgi:hypothetical protein
MEAVGTSAWSVLGSTVLSKEADAYEGAQCLRSTLGSGPGTTVAYQLGLTSGIRYRIAGAMRSPYGALIQIQAGSVTAISSSASGWVSDTGEATASSSALRIALGSTIQTGEYSEADALTVEAMSISAISPTASSTQTTTVLNDGNMEKSGVTDWTAGSSAVLTKETGTPHGGNQVLRIAYNGVNNPYASQTVLTIGRTYRIHGWARSDGSSAPRVFLTGNGYVWSGAVDTNWQEFDVEVVAAGTTVRLVAIAASGHAEFDDVTIVDIDAPLEDFSNATATEMPWEGDTGWLYFDGVADDIPYAGNPLDFTYLYYSETNPGNYPTFTAALAINPSALTGTHNVLYIPDPGIDVALNSSGGGTVLVRGDGVTLATVTIPNATFAVGTAATLILVADGSDLYAYVDGSEVGSGAFANTPSAGATGVPVLGSTGSSNFFAGQLTLPLFMSDAVGSSDRAKLFDWYSKNT